MIQFKSDHGDITVSSAVFSNITGMAATNCFGVKGMAYRSMTDGLVHLLRREAMKFTQWGYVFAMSVASLLPVLIIFICCQKYFVSGLQTGGIKG